MATEILADKTAITHRALEIVLELYQAAIATRGLFTLVAAGGSTPKLLYQNLALQNLDWQKFHVFWGDERYVPVSDPQSNQGMTRTAWLDLVPIPAENVHPMPTDLDDPAIAAAQYSQTIQGFFGAGEPPVFDLILLGIGDDGHTASLFPHTAALTVSDRWVTVGEKEEQPRLTLTYPLINQAREILFLVDGESKAPAVAAILGSQAEDIKQYPARGIRSRATWLISEGAAALLP